MQNQDLSFRCKYNNCTSIFKDKYGFVDHLRSVHHSQVLESEYNGLPLLKCPFCRQLFIGDSGVKRHKISCSKRPQDNSAPVHDGAHAIRSSEPSQESQVMSQSDSHVYSQNDIITPSQPSTSIGTGVVDNHMMSQDQHQSGMASSIAIDNISYIGHDDVVPEVVHEQVVSSDVIGAYGTPEAWKHLTQSYFPVRRIAGSMSEFIQVVCALVDIIVDRSGDTASQATIILLSLPIMASTRLHGTSGARAKRVLYMRLFSLLEAQDLVHKSTEVLHWCLQGLDRPMVQDIVHDEEGLIPDSLLNRMSQLISVGRTGKALSVFEDRVYGKSQTAYELPNLMDLLQRLHPQGTMDDALPVLGEEVPTMTLTEEDISTGLSNLPKLSAAGLSGWTYELLQEVGSNDAGLKAMKKLFDHMLSNKAPLSNLWNASKLVPILKPDGNVRPIAVVDAWTRLLGRIVARKVERALSDVLAPYQCGVGVKGGCENIIHIVNNAAHHGKAVLTVDFKNAFNSIRRKFIMTQVDQAYPDLAPYFMWAYGRSTPIYLSDGRFVGYSETGVRQGDPMGPIYFALGIVTLLKHVADRHNDASPLAYLDDVTVTGDPMVCLQAYQTIATKCLEFGLQVSSHKSHIWHHDFTFDDNVMDTMAYQPAIAEHGLVLLGTPIGAADYVRNGIVDVMRKRGDVLEALAKTDDARVVFPLISSCVNARPVYWMKTCLPSLTLTGATTFDSKVDECLAKLCRVTLGQFSQTSQLIRHLPSSKGGLGIRRMVDLRSPAFIASFKRADRWLHDNMVNLHEALSVPCEFLTQVESVKRQIESLFMQRPALQQAQEPSHDAADDEWALRKLMNDVDRIVESKLMDGLSNEMKVWHTSSASVGTTSWLWCGSRHRKGSLMMEASEYATSLGLRLMLPMVPFNANLRRQCDCGWEHDELSFDSAQHSLYCKKFSGRKLRHDQVRDALSDLLSRLGYQPHVEMDVLDGKKMDVVVNIGAVNHYVDVSIVHAGANSYLDHSIEDADYAMNLSMSKKRSKYGPLHDETRGNVFIPFVMETTGRMSKVAADFIDSVTGLGGSAIIPDLAKRSARKFFLQRLSVIMARNNARLVKAYESHTHLLPSRHLGDEYLE